jgi:hypothetical protein
LGVVNVFEGGAGFGEAVDLAVDVAVVEIGGGEDEFAGLDDGAGETDRGVGVAFFGRHGGRVFYREGAKGTEKMRRRILDRINKIYKMGRRV